MFFIILAILLILGTIIYDLKKYGYCDSETLFVSILFTLLSLVISFIIFFVGTIVVQSSPDPINRETKTIETVNLIAVKDNILLTSRSSNSNYYYYTYDTEYGIASDKTPAAYSFIKYVNENEQPYMVHTREYSSQFVYYMWGLCADWYTFYIPEGSVVEDYMIDLE